MTVRCPSCGATESVHQLTPGFYECANRIVVGAIPPGTHGNAVPLPAERACGTRFQVATTTPEILCACGRQSIGNCVDCGQALCGTHGSSTGLFLCADCIAARTQQEQQARREATQQATAEQTAMLASVDARKVAHAAAKIDPYAPGQLAAKAWADYLRLADPPPPFEFVRLTRATRWQEPQELSREAVWRYVHVERGHLHGKEPRSRRFYVDRHGDYTTTYGTNPDPYVSAPGRCIAKASEPLTFKRFARGKDRYGLQNVGLVNGLSCDEPKPAPTLLLVAMLCTLASLPVPDFGLGWSAL